MIIPPHILTTLCNLSVAQVQATVLSGTERQYRVESATFMGMKVNGSFIYEITGYEVSLLDDKTLPSYISTFEICVTRIPNFLDSFNPEYPESMATAVHRCIGDDFILC